MSRRDELDAIVGAFCAVHPGARPYHVSGLDGWAVKVQDAPEDRRGTMPATELVLLPTEKKAGLTIHLWDPRDPGLLAKTAAWLKEAGFRPMVGCLQWNRKARVDVGGLGGCSRRRPRTPA